MGFSIRKVKESDGVRVCALANELGYEVDLAQFFGRLSLLNQNPNHSLWVADSPETGVAAFMHLEKTLHLLSPPRLELMALVVDEKQRGSGLGTRLMKFAESFARTEDLTEVCLTTNVQREKARSFYEKLGYLKTKSSHVYVKTLSVS